MTTSHLPRPLHPTILKTMLRVERRTPFAVSFVLTLITALIALLSLYANVGLAHADLWWLPVATLTLLLPMWVAYTPRLFRLHRAHKLAARRWRADSRLARRQMLEYLGQRERAQPNLIARRARYLYTTRRALAGVLTYALSCVLYLSMQPIGLLGDRLASILLLLIGAALIPACLSIASRAWHCTQQWREIEKERRLVLCARARIDELRDLAGSLSAPACERTVGELSMFAHRRDPVEDLP